MVVQTVASTCESVSSTNAMVGSLSEAARAQLQLTVQTQGAVLMEAGEKARYVYFPLGCAVTLLHTLENGSAAEVSIVGREGMVGVELFLSGEQSLGSAVVSSAGLAYRLRVDLFKREVVGNAGLRFQLLNFAQALMAQIAQTAACNRHHTVRQQLCRWLLLSSDRIGSNKVSMTHELIANMLGVRREGVTEAACKLQQEGIISYVRGQITVLDRHRMESRSCECYDVIRRTTERLLVPPIEREHAPASSRLPHFGLPELRPSARRSVLSTAQ